MSCHGVSTGTMSSLRTYLIRRLDGVEQDYTVDKKCNGSELLDKVRRVEKEGTCNGALPRRDTH